MALNCPSDGLIDGLHHELHMSDATGTTFTKVMNITSVGAVGSSSIATDDVATLDDNAAVPVPVGRKTIDPIAIAGLQKSGDVQQTTLHAIYSNKECRRFKIIKPDTLKTTYEFCAHITDWKPTNEVAQKGRMNFTLTVAGDFIITTTAGQVYPVLPAP